MTNSGVGVRNPTRKRPHEVTGSHEDEANFQRLKHCFQIDDGQAIVLTGISKGNPILHVTSSWEKVCGLSKEEALGMPAAITQGEETSIEAIKKIAAALKSRQACKAVLVNYKKMIY